MDMPFIFECQIPCDLETAYHCLRSLYQDVWDAERYLKPKLRYYNLLKPDLSQEEYLSLNIPKYNAFCLPNLEVAYSLFRLKLAGSRKFR